MLAGQTRSPLWLFSRLVFIPKPSDNPSAPITLRPLGLPEIFFCLAGRVTVRIEGPLVGPTIKPLQLGVGIPLGCQIGAKVAQCAFDARKALLAVDLTNAFNMEKRQSTFQGVSALVPQLLCYYMWGYGRETPLIWHGQLVGSSGTGVKQGDLAGPLYFAVSTYPLFCFIRDAIERVATEYFLLLPSFVGVTAICDDLQVVSDPQLALPVAEVVQRKILESGRSLNIAKCRILVYSDYAHLVKWPPQWRPGLCAALLTGQRCWERPSALNRSGRTSSNFGLPRPARQFLRWNTCHPQLPGPSSATVSTSVSTIWRKSRNFPSSKTPSLAWTRLSITPFSALGGSRPSPPT
jgi:hypothetical protein